MVVWCCSRSVCTLGCDGGLALVEGVGRSWVALVDSLCGNVGSWQVHTMDCWLVRSLGCIGGQPGSVVFGGWLVAQWVAMEDNLYGRLERARWCVC